MMINRKAVRLFVLDTAKRNRAHEFTRVSPEVYEMLEARIREWCRRMVHSQPSAGKTIKP